MNCTAITNAAVTMIVGLWAVNASAEETRFMCTTEAAIIDLATQVRDVPENDSVTDILRPFLDRGDCFWLPHDVHIEINYRGRIIGGKQIVGFKDDVGQMLYGFMPPEPSI